MASVAGFASRFSAIDAAAVLSAFALGYLVKYTFTDNNFMPRTIKHHGYAKKSRPTETEDGKGDEKQGCPYEYILCIYGRHHFAPFVKAFRPTLQQDDPEKYTLVLDIMDAVHFCLILVDDICDDSTKRKNKTAAHLIYGSCETANRAYFVLTKVINRAMRERPVLGLELLSALEQILEGQDLSLVWRRDGLQAFNFQADDRVTAYKNMAKLKTGTLFVLLGSLLNDGGNELDDMFVRFGWYAQLQNDCKNIYSEEYAINKGTMAEDLRNGELSFPIVMALNDNFTKSQMQKEFQSQKESDIVKALAGLETPGVKNKCMKALQEAGQGLDKLVAVWGRREQMAT